jgi:hypothetical protein
MSLFTDCFNAGDDKVVNPTARRAGDSSTALISEEPVPLTPNRRGLQGIRDAFAAIVKPVVVQRDTLVGCGPVRLGCGWLAGLDQQGLCLPHQAL